MGRHLLCYVRRDHLTAWKLDAIARSSQGDLRIAYGSDAPIIARCAEPGVVLWVIGGSRDHPPSLEARIEIAERIERGTEWNVEVVAKRGTSHFFGLNDASQVLRKVVLDRRNGLSKLPAAVTRYRVMPKLGMYLQQPV